jgi:hypothetical protein
MFLDVFVWSFSTAGPPKRSMAVARMVLGILLGVIRRVLS